jgi:hypothetical protein
MAQRSSPRRPAVTIAEEHASLVQALSQSFVAAEHHRAALQVHSITDSTSVLPPPVMVRWGNSGGQPIPQSAQSTATCRWKQLRDPAVDPHSSTGVIVQYPPWDAPPGWRPSSSQLQSNAAGAENPTSTAMTTGQLNNDLEALDSGLAYRRRLKVKTDLLSKRPPPFVAGSSRQSLPPPTAPSPSTLTADCFVKAPKGSCVLTGVGPDPSEALLTAVFNELRRHRESPPQLDNRGSPIVLVDATGLKNMPRLDPSGTALAPDAADKEATIHSLLPRLGSIILVGDPEARAHRISRLSLDDCGLHDADAVRFAAMIKNPLFRLTHVSFRRNHLSPNGADAIKKALKYNTTLVEIDLSENPWLALDGYDPSGEEVLRVIADRLTNNKLGTSNLNPIKRLLR